MAIFGKKKDVEAPDVEDDNAPQDDNASNGAQAFSPDKARVFFDRAQTTHDTGNPEYATTLWLNGLAQDPSSMEGFEGFVRAVQDFVSEQGKKASSKEIAKALQGKGAILKYQNALLAWGMKPDDSGLALKAAEAAGGLGLAEITRFLGRIAFNAARADKKQRKDVYVKLLDVFEKGGVYELAVQAAEIAKQMDPSDGDLDRRWRDLSAQQVMKAGGFGDTGEGGYRKNVRDIEKQTMLEAQEAISKTEDVKDRLVAQFEAEYEEQPEDLPRIERFGRALIERGKGKDLVRALTLYNKAHKDTGQFRFRQRAGEVQLRIARANIRRQRQRVEGSQDQEQKVAEQEKLDQLQTQLHELEARELRLQVENYPTDLALKYQLGKKLFELGQHDEAISQLQLAQEDAKHRREVLGYLARCFQAIGWDDEAVGTYRRALDGIPDEGSDLALELRYGLGCALEDKSGKERDLEAAEEADKLFSAIAMKKFDYRDIRDRRNHVKTLLSDLRG